jgi:hypothetical protein
VGTEDLPADTPATIEKCGCLILAKLPLRDLWLDNWFNDRAAIEMVKPMIDGCAKYS